ncbi:hydrolase 2, exosortase A system-associated [Parazoarcus communis]|uniref:Hydrolase 2, exosortase A system-associated n=1 Tax=Parazoarcus communis TaxID=41977 RepID=A0A2U8GVH7_9RHOO|nr:hydrolase 2, exosortase A system-associated [Parazoarcus communis]AWI77036.1 hydrolase 2, exosortase A system-associated [Parazoarcus communis]
MREAFFLDAPRGGRFCLATRPAGTSKGAILFVPPFAEELNKSRRMVALAAGAFAREGWTVLQMDCFGCGDSAGDFSDASWKDWIQDLGSGWDWLQQDGTQRASAKLPLVLWTLRSGSLLAADWMHERGECPPLLIWQPVTSGKQHLTQFLRLKAANEMLAESDARQVMASIRAALQRGENVEVAGYGLSPALASGMDAANLRLPAGYAAPVAILELGSAERADSSPAVASLTAKWTAAAIRVRSEVVAGPGFWQTQEIETAPLLIERSLGMLEYLAQ